MEPEEQREEDETGSDGGVSSRAAFRSIEEEEDRYESGAAMTSNARRTMWQMALGLVCLGLLGIGALLLVRYRDDIAGEVAREKIAAATMPVGEANEAVRAMPEYEEAMGALGSGNFERVLSRVAEMELYVNGSSVTRYLAARAYDGMGEVDASKDASRAAVERSPDDVEALYFHGRLLQATGDPGATAVFEHIVEVDEKVLEAWHELGNQYFGLERGEDALGAYERALSLNPGHVGARDGKARILEARGRLEEALAILKEGYEMNPANAEACMRLSMYYSRQDDLPNAGTYAMEALRADPTSARCVSWLATVLELQGNNAAALAVAEEALAKAPDDPAIALQTGFFLAKGGRPARSNSLLKKVVDEWPENDVALLVMGSNFMALNDYIEARERFRKVVELNPDRVEAWEGLAEACRILEDWSGEAAARERVAALRGR
ncbi:MAG: tetratricopeptide repeat protein [Verrucomicrobiota bacterium]